MALNVTTQQLLDLLKALAAEQGKAVREYVQSQGFATEADLIAKFNEVNAKIDSIIKIDANDGVETLAEKVQALQDLLNSEEGVVQEILDRLTANEKAISDLAAKEASDIKLIQDALAALQTKVDNNTQAISNLQDQVTKEVAELESEIQANAAAIAENKKAIDVLNGDASVEGSVDYKVAQETARAKAAEAGLAQAIETAKADAIKEAVSEANAYTDQKVQEAIDSLDVASDSEFQALEERVTEIENVLNDTTNEDGELEKGLVSQVKDLQTGLANEAAARAKGDEDTLAAAKAYADSVTVKAGDIDVNVIVSVFVDALNGTATATTTTSTDSSTTSTDGTAL
jgi:polyhydroxyalkanoate synthesis regulator phasin